jgi:large subunit ribosomal protein L4
MSPAAQDETPEQETAAEGTEETVATEAAEAASKAADAASEAAQAASKAAKAASAAAKAKTTDAKTADAKTADAKTADAKTADGEEADKAPAEEAPAKPARKRAAAASAESGTPAAAKPAAKATKAPARPAKKAKAPAASTAVEVDLPAHIFDAKVNLPLIHQVVVAQQAAARQGTHATKTRGDVRGGGRKPYRQKGTGRARQGSTRAPQFTGGGVVHGPVSRSHAQKTPKKMKVAALRGALSDRARHGLVQVVEGFVDGGVPKTADAISVLGAVIGSTAGSATVLVVADSTDQVTWKSLRNARGVHLIDPGQLNTYDVLVNDRVVFTSAAYESFVARVGVAGRQEDEER